MSCYTVTYSKTFWTDQQIHRTHEIVTMCGASEEKFKICASRGSKNALPAPVYS